MTRLRGSALARASVRLVALSLLLAPLLISSLTPPPNALAAGCNGDEQLLLAPLQPRVGSPMIVAAVSRFAHEQVLMLGPAGPLPVQRQPLGERFLWPATVVPDQAGEYLFAFGVANGTALPTTCANTIVTVAGLDILAAPNAPGSGDAAPVDPNGTPGTTALAPSVLLPSLHPWLNGTPTPTDPSAPAPDEATDGGTDANGTPRPTRTPTRGVSSDNGNDNDDDNDNRADPTPSRTPTSTREPTPTRTPTETRTPTLTRTPRPDATETSTPTPRPDPTDEPTATPRPDPTDEPTATPRPDPTNTRTPTPRPDPTNTRTPTPRPDPTDTPVPTPTRTPRPDPTDTPTPTPTLEPAEIESVSGSAVCGQPLTIRGRRFGANRNLVNGSVKIDGRDADVIAWEMTRIEVRVPFTARRGNDRQLSVEVAGRTTAPYNLRISC